MKKQPIFIAAMFTVFMFPFAGSVSNADAEKGSRLCGISYDDKAILIKVEHPNKKKKIKKIKKLCDRLTDEMEQELIEDGIDIANTIRYRRVSCQDFESDMSSGKTSSKSHTICPYMRRTKPNKEVKVYEIDYRGGDEFGCKRRGTSDGFCRP